MDQETAKQLFECGAFVILQDFPSKSVFGFDFLQFSINTHCIGLKMIPPGVHFITFKAISKATGDLGIKHSLFHQFSSKEILVFKWKTTIETIECLKLSDEELKRYRMNLKNLDRFLPHYDPEYYQKWFALSDKISSSIIDRLTPSCGYISAVDSDCSEPYRSSRCSRAVSDREFFKLPLSFAEAERRMPVSTDIVECVINFTDIPRRIYPEGSSGQQLTEHSLDLTFTLETLLHTKYDNSFENLLGEMQFAFICIMFGEIYLAFEQYLKLLYLICHSFKFMENSLLNVCEFLKVIYFQLKEMPYEVLCDLAIEEQVCSSLKEMCNYLSDASSDDDFKSRLNKFKEYVSNRYDIDFDSVNVNELPVIA